MSRHRKGFRSSDSYLRPRRRGATTPNVRRVDGVDIRRTIGGWIFSLQFVDVEARFRLERNFSGSFAWRLLQLGATPPHTPTLVSARILNFKHAVVEAKESLTK
jgi:hypothetical protein